MSLFQYLRQPRKVVIINIMMTSVTEMMQGILGNGKQTDIKRREIWEVREMNHRVCQGNWKVIHVISQFGNPAEIRKQILS